MSKETAIKLFEQKEVRSLWSDEDDKWYFSIIDIISILTDQLVGICNPDYLTEDLCSVFLSIFYGWIKTIEIGGVRPVSDH